MDAKTLKLLLVEDNPEDEDLIREALIEIEEGRKWGKWNSCHLAQVDRLQDAVDYMHSEQYDAVLLNLSLPDTPVMLDAFLEARTAAQSVPIIVLADEDDPAMAERLIREGAQDVIVKAELECAPLARSVRYGIERARKLASARSHWFLDELTGSYNRDGFVHIAPHYLRLSRKARQAASLISFQFQPSFLLKKDDLELALIRAAEVARVLFNEVSLLGRLDSSNLTLLGIGLTQGEAESLAQGLCADLSAALGPIAQPRFRIISVDEDSPIEVLLEEFQREVAVPAMLAD